MADYGYRLQDRLALYAPDENAVKPYVARLADMKQILRDEKNRLKAPATTPQIRDRIGRHIGFLTAEIESLSKELQETVRQNPRLLQKQRAMITQTGVGETSANSLLAYLPELGTLSRRKIAAIAGLAPYARDSGTLKNARHVTGGRIEIKRTLFICALVAIKKRSGNACFLRKIDKIR